MYFELHFMSAWNLREIQDKDSKGFLLFALVAVQLSHGCDGEVWFPCATVPFEALLWL